MRAFGKMTHTLQSLHAHYKVRNGIEQFPDYPLMETNHLMKPLQENP